jgi:futalosine hydrolase
MTLSETLLIVAAVKEELEWLAGHLHKPQDRSMGPHALAIGKHRHREVALLLAGAGTVNTAGALGAVIPALRPRGVVLCGCGGAFSGWGLINGDVVFATEEIAPQLGVEPDRKGDPVTPLPFLPNRIQLDDALAHRGREALLGNDPFSGVSVQSGPFVTVSTVTASPSTGEGYRRLYGAIVENMEGFAAARLCQRYAVPLLEVRSVSNMVGARDRSKWNLDLAFKRAQEAVLTLLEKEIMP